MFGRFVPKETSFFDFFEQHAALTLSASRELVAMAEAGANLGEHANSIRDFEHGADVVTHNCIGALHKTFITPFDRSDIHRLIGTLDDVIDNINDAASRIVLYDLKELLPEIMSMGQVLVRSSLLISEAVKLLRSVENEKAINKKCVEIRVCENDGDIILRNSIGRLFREEADIKKIVQWKEILEYLEEATDRCEDVANVIEGVIIEAS